MVLLVNTTATSNNKLQKTVYANLTTNFQQDVKSVIDDAEILEKPFPNCVTFDADKLLHFILSTKKNATREDRGVNAFNIKFTKLSGDILNDPRFNQINANQISVIIEPASVTWGGRLIPNTTQTIYDLISERHEVSSDLGALDFGTISPPY
ncbi:MAG TPA: hypothetical protein DCQ50_04255 [Chryseobacterium sp.]|nr:hypothetical protein [Chryseobacterium sp.]